MFIVVIETLHFARAAVRHHDVVAVTKFAQHLALAIPDGDEIALRRVVIAAQAFGVERVRGVTDADADNTFNRVVIRKRKPGKMDDKTPSGAVGYLLRLMMRVVVQRQAVVMPVAYHCEQPAIRLRLVREMPAARFIGGKNTELARLWLRKRKLFITVQPRRVARLWPRELDFAPLFIDKQQDVILRANLQRQR